MTPFSVTIDSQNNSVMLGMTPFSVTVFAQCYVQNATICREIKSLQLYYIVFFEGTCDDPLIASGLHEYEMTVSGEAAAWPGSAVSYSIQPDGINNWAWSSNAESTPWIQV